MHVKVISLLTWMKFSISIIKTTLCGAALFYVTSAKFLCLFGDGTVSSAELKSRRHSSISSLLEPAVSTNLSSLHHARSGAFLELPYCVPLLVSCVFVSRAFGRSEPSPSIFNHSSESSHIRRKISSVLLTMLFSTLPTSAFSWNNWLLFQMQPTARLNRIDSLSKEKHSRLISAAKRATVVITA